MQAIWTHSNGKNPLQSPHQRRRCDALSKCDGLIAFLKKWKSATVSYVAWIKRHHLYLLSCCSTQLRFYSSSSTHGHANNFCAIHLLFFALHFSLAARLQLEFNGQAHLALTQFSQMENKASFSSHLFHGRNKPFACSVCFLLARSLGQSRTHPTIHQVFLTSELL